MKLTQKEFKEFKEIKEQYIQDLQDRMSEGMNLYVEVYQNGSCFGHQDSFYFLEDSDFPEEIQEAAYAALGTASIEDILGHSDYRVDHFKSGLVIDLSEDKEEDDDGYYDGKYGLEDEI